MRELRETVFQIDINYWIAEQQCLKGKQPTNQTITKQNQAKFRKDSPYL